MPLSWNEIKDRAVKFSKEWANTQSEDADAKPFLDAFFEVFGVSRKKIGTFEHKVKKLNDADGYIDLLWKGTILIEMKSLGKNLDKAFAQAKEYAQKLPQAELPRYILVCDFDIFRLFDTEEQTTSEFHLADFVKNVNLFGFISGYQKKIYKEQDPANIKAAELMGKLHDRLEEIGYKGHPLEVYLVRLLFCLFAEDTTIFNKQQLQDYIEQRTSPDGSDLAARLQELFQVLNTPADKRFTNLDEQLAEFPYVNGKLFEEVLPSASFDSAMRQALLNCCYLDWSKISPAIFGSMFQSVMNPKERRNLGAHYTSEKNILKLIKPLFLDALWEAFNKAGNKENELKKLSQKISQLRFLDPACGCGNFLIIAYRELRLLEMAIVERLLKGQTVTDVSHYLLLDVDRFYGIEYEEFPAQIAQVAMWLIDHQMNMQASETFGEYYIRLPLRKSATIVHGNALRVDWQSLIDQLPFDKADNRFHFIFGNPPFVGKKEQNDLQKKDVEFIFQNAKGSGVLDYVTAWYIKGAEYMKTHNTFLVASGKNAIEQPLRRTLQPQDVLQQRPTQTAFVSTNSISQGEQVCILWNELFNKYQCKIHFAHRTFSWSNEAKGKAAVHCVIIGFSNYDTTEKTIYEYEVVKGEPHKLSAKNINPYLIEGNDTLIQNRKSPLCNVPEMNYGSMPIDEGNLIVSDEEFEQLKVNDPEVLKFIRPYTGGDEFINAKKRWCIWLDNFSPSEYRSLKFILNRIELTKKFRLQSQRLATNKLAESPGLFGEIRQPNSDYIIIPKVSSETRKYLPIGILKPIIITSGSALIIPKANYYSFGVINSIMQMTWMKYTCGRMKSDYQYSASIVYNNYPWPENPTEKQKEAVEAASQAVLDARAQFPNSSLADLYDPNTMPPVLVKAHQTLDKAVDLCYRPQPFANETKRIEFLFELYDKYTAGLFVKEKKKKK